MTPVRTAISTPNAWTNSEIVGKTGRTHRLASARLAAFDALLAEARFSAQPVEALDYFDTLAERDDIGVHFMLEPGEMMPHARDSYRDSPRRARHLPRLWLRIENDRPIAGEILQRGKIYERIYRERSGRVPMEV